MHKRLFRLLGAVLPFLLIEATHAQFVAFNDHFTGPGTAPNATTWNVFTNLNGAPGNSGPLKDINSGATLPVILTITNIGVGQGSSSGAPDALTPAYNVFNGYVDFGLSGTAYAIQLPDGAKMGHVFTNLNPIKRYRITVTSIRNGGYTDRWTVFELAGAGAFNSAHSAGCLTGSTIGLTTNDIAPNQCVINTGANTVGDIAVWDNVVPGGTNTNTFTVLSSVYRGTVPLGSSAGTYAYGVIALKLEEFDFLPSPVAITAQPQNRTVNEGQSASFSLVMAGVPYPAVQWYRVDAGVTNALPNATNTTYSMSAVGLSDNGAIFFAVAQNTISNTLYSVTSSSATLTVVPDLTPPALLNAFAASSLTNVTLVFSEPISQTTATNIANYVLTNYSLGGNAIILSAVLQNSSNVVLNTRPLTNGSTYIAVVSNLRDVSAAGNVIAPGSSFSFLAQSSFNLLGFGIPSPAGTYTATNNGMDVSGGGTDIGGSSDNCQFVYQTRSGDFDVRVRIASISLADPWAKAGIMARPAGTASNAPFAATLATPNLSGCMFESRTVSSGVANMSGAFPINFPYTWVRLQRTNGTNWAGYASVDGVNWAQLGTSLIAMADPVYVGFTLSSHAPSVGCTAQFRDYGDVVSAAPAASSVSLPVEPLGPSSRQTVMVISEIMYHPSVPGVTNSLEFIELFNSGSVPQVLTGYRLSGSIHYSFPTGTTMQPGTFLVVAREPAFLQTYYGITNVLGPWYANEAAAAANDFTGNNLPSSGTIRLRNRQNAIMLEVPYQNSNPWPPAADGWGYSLVLAHPSYGEGDPRAWAASDRAGGSPGKPDAITIDPLSSVVINELMPNSHTLAPSEDYLELYNHGNQDADLSGAYIQVADGKGSPNHSFKIPNGTHLGPRAFAVFYKHQLIDVSDESSFGLNTQGGRVSLINSNQTKIIDMVEYEAQAKGASYGRYPDGAPTFRELTACTPGTTNASILLRDIVINEIMYNPISGSSDDEYLELYNKGTNAVDLINWQFTAGINFTFTNSMVIAPDGYVVVAHNKANIKYKYNLSDAVVAGDYSGTLANGGERIALSMPDQYITTNKDNLLETNTVYVVENEVTYGDGGRWGNWSDGGGSSLELIDPHSDNRQPANWADSDESGKGTWTAIDITLTNGIVWYASPDNIHVYLLDAGECLVDDVKVLNSSSVNILGDAQGSFNSGVVLSNVSLALLNANGGNLPANFTTNWLAQGIYDQSTIDPAGGINGSPCLHVRTAGHGDPGPNRIRSPLFSVNASGVMHITAQAKWLRGWPEIILRVHSGAYEVVRRLDTPSQLGSPGAPNPKRIANAGPAIWAVTHAPVLPAANEAVVVTARTFDPDGISSMQLLYRVDTNVAFTAVPMRDDGTGGDAVAGDGLYSATLPGIAAGLTAGFYIQAVDNLGATNLFPQDVFPQPGMERCFPNDSFTRECVIHWGDFVMPGSFATYHLWLTPGSLQRWQDREPRSNGEADWTFAYNNFRVIYNAGGRCGGSPFHRGQQVTGPVGTQRCDYDVSLPADEPFLGESGFSTGYPGNTSGTDNTDHTGIAEKTSLIVMDEMLTPFGNRRFIHLFINGSQRSAVSGRTGNFIVEDAIRPNGALVNHWWPDDSNGELVKLDDYFEFNDAATAFNNDDADFTRRIIVMNGVEMLQTNKYRFQWQRHSALGMPPTMNYWSNFWNLLNAISPTTADYAPVSFAKMNVYADVEEWAHEIAGRHCVGDYDSWGYNRGKNNFMYKPLNDRYQFIPFDVDWSMGQSGSQPWNDNLFSASDARAVAMYTNAEIRRIFLRAYKDATDGPFNNAFMDPWINAYTNAFAANNINFDPAGVVNMKTFIQQRHDYIVTNYLVGTTNPFSISTPTNIVTGTNWVTLSGYAPVGVKNILINGLAYPVTWSTITNWSVSLFVNQSVNSLVVRPTDRFDNTITNYVATNSVTVTNPVTPLAGSIIFSEIMYNPTMAGASYVELLNTSSNFTFDISGWRINGLGDYTFPGGSYITNRQYIVLAKDRGVFALAYGSAVPVFDTFPGSLDNNGETLTLIRPGGTVNGSDLVINKVRYDSAQPWPMSARAGAALQLIDFSQDNSRVGNWSGGAEWHYFQMTNFSGNPSGATKYLYLYPPDGSCDVYLDDIKLFLGTNTVTGTNVLSNSDFESGTTNYWILNGGATNIFVTNTVSHSGSYSIHLSGTNFGNPNSSGIGQAIPGFVANTTYTLSYWYLPNFKGTNLLGQIGFLQAKFKATNNNLFSLPYSPGVASTMATSVTPFPPLWLNEVQPQNLATVTNRFGQYAPWVEVYNSGANPLDLGGYFLANNYSTNIMQWAFPTGTVIQGGGFKVVWLDGAASNSVPEELHANFTIPPSTGSVALVRMAQVGTNIQSQYVDYLNYAGLGANLSYGAYPDGQPFTRQTFFKVTPGGTNDATHSQIFINEWLAQSSSSANGIPGIPNPASGTYDDWFELYNPNSVDVDLHNWFLTDTNANKTQYQIPSGYTVPANGYLVVWADNKPGRNSSSSPDLHVNFNLNKDGEQIGLYDQFTNQVDLISFGSQQGNISQGRYADGTSDLRLMPNPTPGAPNVWFANLPPALQPLPDLVVTQGQTLIFTNVAIDPNGTNQIMTYHLGNSPPLPNTSMQTLSPPNNVGVFIWRTLPDEVPGLYVITNWVEDNGLPRLSAGNSYNVLVVSTNTVFNNTSPIISPIADQGISVGQTLSFTISATDTDTPPQTLTYTLDGTVPPGVVLNPGSGLFTWTPLAPGTNQFTVRATDNGLPPMSSTAIFTVRVTQQVLPPTLAIFLDGSAVVVSWPDQGPFQLQTSFGLGALPSANWQPYAGPLSTNLGAISARVPVTTNQFFRLFAP